MSFSWEPNEATIAAMIVTQREVAIYAHGEDAVNTMVQRAAVTLIGFVRNDLPTEAFEVENGRIMSYQRDQSAKSLMDLDHRLLGLIYHIEQHLIRTAF